MKKKLEKLCEPVAENIWAVHTPGNGKYPYCFSFLITGKENILIDPNCDFEKMKALRKAVDIHKVIISHSHPDHFAGAWIFIDLPILFPHESPKEIYDINFLARRATGGGEMAKIWIDVIQSLMDLKPVYPTGFFYNGDMLIDETDIKLKALHTPGHLIDHYVFFEEMTGILFSFDIDFTEFGPWHGYRECSLTDFRRSLDSIRSLPVKKVLSSHRLPIKNDIRKEIDHYEEGIERQKDKIRKLMSPTKGIRLQELTDASPFYKVPGNGIHYLKKIEGCMIKHLLDEMMEQGEVIKNVPVSPEEEMIETEYLIK